MLLYAVQTFKGTLFFPYQGFLMKSPKKKLFENYAYSISC